MERNVLSRAAEYINQQRKKKRWTNVVSVLAAVVVFCTTYALILPAITLETDVFCGREEHTHGADCYGQVLTCTLPEGEAHVHTDACYQTERTLVCTLKESQGHTHTADCQRTETLLTCTSTEEGHVHGEGCYTTTTTYVCGLEESSGHTHTDACWQETRILVCTQNTEGPQGGHVHSEACYGPSREPTCGLEEHRHDDACYADREADRETAAQWEKTFDQVELSGEFPADVLAIAETQLGYTESSRNYIINDQGRKLGYSRYGAWYGAPYGDWCAMFVSFCLHYGGVPAEAFPREASCQRWIEDLTDLDLYRETESYIPNPGDLVFFNWDTEPDADHVGLVEEIVLDEKGNCKEIKTIEGNSSNRVQRVTYDWGDPSIMGYGELPRLPKMEGPLMMSTAPQAEGGTEYTYYDEATEITFILSLENSNYSPATHELVVVPMALVDSLTQNFTAHGQVVQEALNYQIYLRDKGTGQEDKNLSGAYKLTVSKEDGLFKTPGEAKDYSFLYCMNLNNQPTDLPNCNVTYSADGNITQIIASAGSYPNSSQFVFVRTSAPDGLRASDYTLTYNNTKDAFLTDSAYSKYYNPNSPIGTAGSFHIVAFEEVRLNSHTNGNILAKKLYAGSNFGTNNYAEELSYVQNYEQVQATSASRDNHVLALGSENTVGFTDNGNKFSFNGVEVTKPKRFVQDKDTATAPLIDLWRVESEIRQISSKLNQFNNANLTYSSHDGTCSYLTLSSPSAVGVVHYPAEELDNVFHGYVRIDGFQSGHNGTVVINVDCANVSEVNLPQARVVVDGQEQSTAEVIDFSAGKVIWNFVNADNVVINTHLMTGMVVAPGATVNINQNLNGTVVADNVNVNAESHRTDFTGTVVEPDEDVGDNEYYITVQKTETGYAGTTLPGAEFDLYRWNGTDWVKQNAETLRTNPSGVLTLRHLEASVAYHLVETKAPDGYVLKDGGFYFWIRTDKNQSTPNSRPDSFFGNVIEVGGTLLAANEKAEEEEPSEGYILPETGGPGGQWYILGGILLITGGTLWYRKQDKGKEGTRTS